MLSTAHVWGRPNRLVKDGYRTIAAEGLLGPDHNIAHGNYIEDDELKILVDSGASITSTAAGEMNNHIRPPRTGRVSRLGGYPSIGVDGEVATKGDMFEALRFALQIARLHANQETIRRAESAAHSAAAEFARNNLKTIGTGGSLIKEVSFNVRAALEWATINNAKALRLDHRVGSLTPGKDADLIMLRRDALHLVSAQDPVQTVVSYAQTADVDTVMVAAASSSRMGGYCAMASTRTAMSCGRRLPACWKPPPRGGRLRTLSALPLPRPDTDAQFHARAATKRA